MYGDLTDPVRPTLIVKVGADPNIALDYYCGIGGRFSSTGNSAKDTHYVVPHLNDPTPGRVSVVATGAPA